MIRAGRDNAGADREILDYMAAPAVGVLFDRGPHYAVRPKLLGFRLHPRQRQFAGIIDRLCVSRHFDVLADLREPGLDALIADMIDAVAHDERNRPVAGFGECPEVLPA